MIYLYTLATTFVWILAATFSVIAAEGSMGPTYMIESCLFLVALSLTGGNLTKRTMYNRFILSLCVLWFVLWVTSW